MYMELPVKMLKQSLEGLNDNDMVIIKDNLVLMPARPYVRIEEIKPVTEKPVVNERLAELLF